VVLLSGQRSKISEYMIAAIRGPVGIIGSTGI
jgi:hypothetical protein